MSNAGKAMQLFREGYSCSRAIRHVYLQLLGLPEETCKNIAQDFAQTLHTRPLCGAVTGAFTVLAHHHLSAFSNPTQKREEAHALFATFSVRFRERNAHLSCFDLIGYDVNTEEGMKLVREQQLYKKTCINLVKDAATILEDMLLLKHSDSK